MPNAATTPAFWAATICSGATVLIYTTPLIDG
jgi:hypothetical protein